MGLRETLQNAAGTVFSAVGNVKEQIFYYSRDNAPDGTLNYNASSGVVTAQNSLFVIDGIPSKYSASQVDGSRVLPTDLKFKILQTSLPVKPTQNDYIKRIENYASVKYEMVDFKEDTVSATWDFQLRKP